MFTFPESTCTGVSNDVLGVTIALLRTEISAFKVRTSFWGLRDYESSVESECLWNSISQKLEVPTKM